MFKQRAGANSPLVHLVFAQEGPNTAEPLVAVVESEVAAETIEAEVKLRRPAATIRWESHQVVAGPSETVHVLLMDCSATQSLEPDDPVGIAVYADPRVAAASLGDHQAAEPEVRYLVMSFPLGWRTAGWPFAHS